MRSRLVLSVLAVCLTAIPAFAAFPSPPGSYTHTAVATGNWNQTATWGGSVPGNNAIVRIPSGLRVSVTSLESARIKFIRVEGEMRMWIHSSTRLYVETLYVASGGIFMIGDVNNPVKNNVKAEMIFTSSGAFDLSWDPKTMSRGFISDGKVRMFGQTKTNMVAMHNNALKNATVIDVNNTIPTDWKIGDEIVITGTHFKRNTASQEEKRTITGISGDQLTLNQGLTYDHIRADGANTPLHVANLTRNIVFRSESTSLARDRGHVMFRHSHAVTDVDVRHAAFQSLGRTDKKIPLNDLTVTKVTTSLGTPTYTLSVPADSAVTNRRGRYSVHFHQNGTKPTLANPPSKIYGCVVTDAIGWGYVNHGSHVDFQNNVAYDFDGAAFVTESGSELGNFFDNIAIGGRGNGEYRPIRIVFQNNSRPQPLSDFGFSGDGFWFQGPAVRARGNVANSCDGAGMIWFTTGAPDHDQLFTELVDGQAFTHNRYSHFPRSSLSSVYGSFPDFSSHLPRYWEHSVTDEKINISDLPILECDGFTGYGNLVGFRLRFNNHDNVDWLKDEPFHFETQIVPVIGSNIRSAVRMRQDVENLTLWNNEQSFRARYAQKTDWNHVAVDNRLSYNANGAYSGGEINFQVQNSTLNDVNVNGYEVALWTANGNFNVQNQLTLTNQIYDNYASANQWNQGKSASCTKPTSVNVTNITSSSAKINWTGSAVHTRYLVRYKINGTQAWSFVDTTATSVTVSGLSSGKTYTYQVIAGCVIADSDPATPDGTVGTYTTAATFNTP